MSHVVSISRTEHMTPATPVERAVWLAASTDGDGGAIRIRVVDSPTRWILLPTAAHAAALESVARTIRLQLERQESESLIRGDPPAAATPPTPSSPS